jgi:hypothetical protein
MLLDPKLTPVRGHSVVQANYLLHHVTVTIMVTVNTSTKDKGNRDEDRGRKRIETRAEGSSPDTPGT